MTNPIVFRIPPTPLVDANGRLTPEWLMLLNRLAGMGDQVVSVDLATLSLIVERTQLDQLPVRPVEIDIFPDIPQRADIPNPIPADVAQSNAEVLRQLNNLEMWSLS